MELIIKKVSSSEAIQKCINIRMTVFVEGQNIPVEEEIDSKDDKCEHYLLEADNSPIGTARIRYIDNTAKIERVAILNSYQGNGLGRKLMEYIINDLRKSNNVNKAKLGSQTYAVPFYEKLGFKVCSDEYMDAGIPHKDMETNL